MNYRRAEYDRINKELSQIDWNEVLDGLNCEHELDSLYEILNKQIKKNVTINNRNSMD